MRQTHRQRRVSRETDEGRQERMSLEEEGQKCDQGQAGIQENVRNAQPVFV